MKSDAKRRPGARVVLPDRRHSQRLPIVSAILPDAEDFVVKTFSAGTAALQLAGRNAPETAGNQHQGPLSDEERELIRRQIDCRRRLIVMKSRNAETEDPSGRTVIPQEDLQEWLDNLQLRLHRACLTPNPPQIGNPERAKRPSRLSVSFADNLVVPSGSPRNSSSNSSSPEPAHPPTARLKMNQGAITAANSPTVHPLITRPRSISVITDQAAAALTDGNYIEQLQVSLQQASVSSLHERLQERRTSSVGPALMDQLTNQKSTTNSVRLKHSTPGSPTKTRVRKKSSTSNQLVLLPDKHNPAGSASLKRQKSVKSHKSSDRPKTSADETESMLSLSSSASSRSLDHLLARQQGRSPEMNCDEKALATDRSDDNRPLTHSSPLPGRSKQFAPRNFFDSGQTVDDIYVAAEHLLLPPARREANMSEPTQSIQTETVIKVQRGSPEEAIQVEDFWGAMPDY